MCGVGGGNAHVGGLSATPPLRNCSSDSVRYHRLFVSLTLWTRDLHYDVKQPKVAVTAFVMDSRPAGRRRVVGRTTLFRHWQVRIQPRLTARYAAVSRRVHCAG